MPNRYNRDIHHRQSIRLHDYDYASAGAYFVTICTWQRECVFGEVRDGVMVLNEYGVIVEKEWMRTSDIRSNVEIDKYVIMPNHFHGILIMERRGVLQYARTNNGLRSPSQTIGAIVRGFKSTTTKQINISRDTQGQPVWHRNYYEHVIRNEKELYAVRKYIRNNPLNWDKDEDNPEVRARCNVPLRYL